MEAILHGQECANNLKKLIENHYISSAVEPLIDTILGSFSLALSFMNAPNPTPHPESSSQRSQKKKVCGVESTMLYRDDSPTPLLYDGFFWRKYGQKTIQNSPYQRCYYRCTHAKDQNCNAAKRVQMIQESPPVYRTTYVGQHMCKAVFPNINGAHGSKMINFERYNHVMPESVIHATSATEDKGKGHIMNQECDVNDFLVDNDQSWAYSVFSSRFSVSGRSILFRFEEELLQVASHEILSSLVFV